METAQGIPLERIAEKIHEVSNKGMLSVYIECDGNKISEAELDALREALRNKGYKMKYASEHYNILLTLSTGIFFIASQINDGGMRYLPIPPKKEKCISLSLEEIL